MYNGTEIKQYEKAKYLGSILDQSLSHESMALNIIDKVNLRLKFLHRQNHFLTPSLHRLLCNAIIHPLFDYTCTCLIFESLKKIKITSSSITKQVIRVCLQLDKRSKIHAKEFLQLNWLNVH